MVTCINGHIEIAKWLGSESATAPGYVGVGTGGTAETSADTDLVTEIDLGATDRNSSTNTKLDKQVIFTMNLTTTQANSNTLVECGLFNDDTIGSDIMFIRQTYALVNKTTSVAIQYKLKVFLKNGL